MRLFNLLHRAGIKTMRHNLLYQRSCGDVLIYCCHFHRWHAWGRVCVCVCACFLCVLPEMYVEMTVAVSAQNDAATQMYPSPKMGETHEQEMKSLNLVVGNGIRKHWPFVGSLRPLNESHDSWIFTVPLVTGLVKSQHTSLKPRRP